MYSICSFLLLYINQKASPYCICFELYLTRYQFNNFNLGFDNSTPKSFIFFLPAMLVFSLFIHIQSYRKCVCLCKLAKIKCKKKKRVYNGKPTPTDTDTDFAHRTTTIVCKHIVNVLFSFIFFFCVCFFFSSFQFLHLSRCDTCVHTYVLYTHVAVVLIAPDWIVNCFGFFVILSILLYTCEAKRKQPNRPTIWKCKEKWQKADCCFGVFSSFSLLCFVCIIFVFRLMYLMKAIYRHRNTEMAKKQTEKGVYSLAMWRKKFEGWVYNVYLNADVYYIHDTGVWCMRCVRFKTYPTSLAMGFNIFGLHHFYHRSKRNIISSLLLLHHPVWHLSQYILKYFSS